MPEKRSCRALTLAVIVLALLVPATAGASVTHSFWPAPPHHRLRCYTRSAPNLCLIHWWVRRTWGGEDVRGMRRTPYGFEAERTTSAPFLTWIRLHWRHRERVIAAIPLAPWPAWWYSQAMCVHSHEASWHNPSGEGPEVSGGMQIGYNEWHEFGGGSYTPAAYEATPKQQLTVAWRYYRVSGWHPWPNTAAMCGLL